MSDPCIWHVRRASRDEALDAGLDWALRPVALLDHARTTFALADRTRTTILWTAPGVDPAHVATLLTARRSDPLPRTPAVPRPLKHRFRVRAEGGGNGRRVGVGILVVPRMGVRLEARKEADWTR